ncbi:glycoside hydrolase family 88 protein [Cohnella hongkongensis]|uniref:Glycoside hydrolase family 88 protein n=1 Tax=Cohnella hongkongensis TaxID=178337 RepID=A0ABV9FII1_9BACL
MNWQSAIVQTLRTTKANLSRFGDRFPIVSKGNGKYVLDDHTSWTEGFWSGILWLSFEYSQEPVFREAAANTVASLRRRLERNIHMDHHDIGFLYSPSAMAQWMLEKDEQARALALQAADALMRRWRERSQLFQAWGPENDPLNGGRIIIDCLMNLPLLYWATEQTSNPIYAERARIHADRSLRYLVRGDDSSYHTFSFDQQTGDAIRGSTHQGARDGSTWTRGQAWGVYGFALAYRYLREPRYLEAARRLARHFIARLPEDHVAYWDFDVPQKEGTPRDSSASAIAACGMLEAAEHLPSGDPDRELLLDAANRSMASLTDRYFTAGSLEEEGFLRHGSYSVRDRVSPDDFVIWGDYFYLEALLRLDRGAPGYWYER